MPKRESCPDDHSELEKVLAYGIYGTPVLKKDERLQFLGQLRERVIFALSEIQVKREEIPDQLRQALNDIRASKLVVKGTTGVDAILKYEGVAKEHGVKMTTVSDPKFIGSIGLVVVSNHAVDVPDDQVFSTSVIH